jgi:hypothetical protein
MANKRSGYNFLCHQNKRLSKSFIKLTKYIFLLLWESSNDAVQPEEMKRVKSNGVNSVDWSTEHYITIHNLINHLSTHFKSAEKMEFFSLLNCDKFGAYKFMITFPECLIWKLIQVYDNIFNCAFLRNKLTVLHGSENFEGNSTYDGFTATVWLPLLNKLIN